MFLLFMYFNMFPANPDMLFFLLLQNPFRACSLHRNKVIFFNNYKVLYFVYENEISVDLFGY